MRLSIHEKAELARQILAQHEHQKDYPNDTMTIVLGGWRSTFKTVPVEIDGGIKHNKGCVLSSHCYLYGCKRVKRTYKNGLHQFIKATNLKDHLPPNFLDTYPKKP